jgi:hypothetical protein
VFGEEAFGEGFDVQEIVEFVAEALGVGFGRGLVADQVFCGGADLGPAVMDLERQLAGLSRQAVAAGLFGIAAELGFEGGAWNAAVAEASIFGSSQVSARSACFIATRSAASARRASIAACRSVMSARLDIENKS